MDHSSNTVNRDERVLQHELARCNPDELNCVHNNQKYTASSMYMFDSKDNYDYIHNKPTDRERFNTRLHQMGVLED